MPAPIFASAAAGSRYEVLQGGIDPIVGPLTGQARIRTDDIQDLSGWFGLTLAR